MDVLKLKNFLRPLLVISNANANGNGGIILFNRKKVYLIDNTKTIITSLKNDIAKGFIINDDLTLKSCFIVRNDYYYSHGTTLKEALKSLHEKTEINLPIEKRIENFKNQFKSFQFKQKASLLYDWHFKLTGSCKMGRDIFVKNHNIDLKKDKFTILEFIELTKNEYNGNIVKMLLENN